MFNCWSNNHWWKNECEAINGFDFVVHVKPWGMKGCERSNALPGAPKSIGGHVSVKHWFFSVVENAWIKWNQEWFAILLIENLGLTMHCIVACISITFVNAWKPVCELGIQIESSLQNLSQSGEAETFFWLGVCGWNQDCAWWDSPTLPRGDPLPFLQAFQVLMPWSQCALPQSMGGYGHIF